MRFTTTPLGATGPGDWQVIDTEQTAFGVGYFVAVQQGSTLTFKIEHGWSVLPTDEQQYSSITRSTTTATLKVPSALTVKVADSIIVKGAGAPFDGTFQVASVTNQNTITYTVANSGATTAITGGFVRLIRTIDDPVVVSKSSSTEGNLAFPCSHIRLNLTAWSAGAAVLTLLQPSGN
jgi:hypothetical protein